MFAQVIYEFSSQLSVERSSILENQQNTIRFNNNGVFFLIVDCV